MKLWKVVKQQIGPETTRASHSSVELELLVMEDRLFVRSRAVQQDNIQSVSMLAIQQTEQRGIIVRLQLMYDSILYGLIHIHSLVFFVQLAILRVTSGGWSCCPRQNFSK